MTRCCGVTNGCRCNDCTGVKMSQFAPQARANAGDLIVLAGDKLISVETLERYLGFRVQGNTGVTFSADASTDTLGAHTLYACTDTSAPRTLTLSTAFITSASMSSPFYFSVKDQSGGAATNNITIDTEGSELIDGVGSIQITANYGVARLYIDGSNVYTR